MEFKENGRFEARRAICAAIVGAILLGVPTRSASATEFNKPLNVSRSRTRIDTLAAIAVDANNKVHIAWNAFYPKAGAPDGIAADIYYTTNVSGKFSALVRISVPTGWYSRDVTIAVDAKGHAHIVFRRSMDQMNCESGDDLYYVTNAKGDFKHPILLVDGIEAFPGPAEVSAPRTPLVHCDSRGYVHLTFLAWQIGDQYEPVVYMNNRSGAWTKPMLAVQGDFLIEHSSAVDRNGYVHIAFRMNDKKGKGHVYYIHNRAGKFSKPTMASAPSHEHASQFQLAVDGRAKAHIVYRAPFVMPNTPDLFYVNNVSGSFRSWLPVCSGNVYYIPQIAVDSSNVVHIAYKVTWPYGGYLYYGNNRTGKFAFSSYGELTTSWYGWPRYFALGKNGRLHFALYDFLSGDAEIYYIAGSWTK
jgi:hypothetical protein